MKSYENCQAHDRLKANRYSFKCKLPPFPGCKSLLRDEGFLQNGILKHCTCHPGGDWHAGWGFRIPGISWCNNNFQLCFLSLSFLKNHRSTGSNRLTTKTDSEKNTASSGILHTKKLSNLSAPSHGGKSWRESSKSVKVQSGGAKKGDWNHQHFQKTAPKPFNY